MVPNKRTTSRSLTRMANTPRARPEDARRSEHSAQIPTPVPRRKPSESEKYLDKYEEDQHEYVQLMHKKQKEIEQKVHQLTKATYDGQQRITRLAKKTTYHDRRIVDQDFIESAKIVVIKPWPKKWDDNKRRWWIQHLF